MPTVQVHGVELFYDDRGSGDPVAFVHGHTLDHSMWDAQVEPLLTAGYRVIRYDLRGHGRSGATETGYTPEAMAADLHGLLQARGVDRAHIVGLSRGGGIALAFALAYPEATRSVTFIDSILPGRRLDTLRQVYTDFQARGKAAFEDTWFKADLFAGARRDPVVAEHLLRMIRLYSAAELGGATEPVPGGPLADRLAEVQAPALILVGELDLPVFHTFADEMATTIPNARKAVIPDAGHMANMERPAHVNAELLTFLKDVG